MRRLDSSVSVMVATEEQAEAIEALLKMRPITLLTSDDVHGGDNFFVVLLDETEIHASEAEVILNK